jgi:hypothetical protein
MALPVPQETTMAESPKLGSSVLVGLIAFIAVSAWVAIEVASSNPYKTGHVIGPRIISDRVATGGTMIPVHASLSPDEAIVTPESMQTVEAPAAAPPAKPGAQRSVTRPAPPKVVVAAPTKRAPTMLHPRIVVEERRLSADERIRLAVIDRLAADPQLDGRIGVDTKDAVVRLTGWTRTAGQARHAEREARSVQQVKQVRNEIRPRVGGSV